MEEEEEKEKADKNTVRARKTMRAAAMASKAGDVRLGIIFVGLCVCVCVC